MKSLYDECLALGIEPDSDQAVYVFAESVLYLIGATGAFEFQRHIKKYCKNRSAKVFRLRLRENRYTNLDVKLFMFGLDRHGATSQKAKRLARDHGLFLRDYKLLWLLYSTNSWFKASVHGHVKHVLRKEAVPSYDSIHEAFDRVYPSVFKYIKHITYTKLRFLVKSNNSTLQDYHSELSIKLVQSFYALVPIQLSEAHLVNYLKRIMHNHAMNMIKSGTTQKRGRLISSDADTNGGRKYNMLCLSQNQMALTAEGEAQDVDGVDDSASVFELRFSISEVLDGLKLKSRKYRFLSILLGHEDKEFSQWLVSNSHCHKHEDNVDVQHRVGPAAYTKLISEFLRIPKRHVDTFFKSLKLQLVG